MNKQQNVIGGVPLRLFQRKTTTLRVANSKSRSLVRRGFVPIALALALAWFAPLPTATGASALFDNTTGTNNTATRA